MKFYDYVFKVIIVYLKMLSFVGSNLIIAMLLISIGSNPLSIYFIFGLTSLMWIASCIIVELKHDNRSEG